MKALNWKNSFERFNLMKLNRAALNEELNENSNEKTKMSSFLLLSEVESMAFVCCIFQPAKVLASQVKQHLKQQWLSVSETA